LTLDNCIAPGHITRKIIKGNAFPQRYEYLINYFETPNKLAESITCDDINVKNMANELMTYKIEHIYHGIGWYLHNGEFIDKHHKKILFVGTQENMNNDIIKLNDVLHINIKNNKKIRENKKTNNKILSRKAINNLINFFEETDYKALRELVKHGFITQHTYEQYRDYF
jgi:hypothetical protein